MENKDDVVFLMILFTGGGKMFQKMPRYFAQDSLMEYRKFTLFRSGFSRERQDEFIKQFLEKYKTLPYTNYFGNYEGAELDPSDPFKSIGWIFDFNYVCGMQICELSQFEDKSSAHTEDALKTQKDAISTTKELVEVLKKQIKEENRGDDWKKEDGE